MRARCLLIVVVLGATACGGTTHHSLIGDASPVGGPVGIETTIPTTTSTSTTVAPTTVAPTTTAAPLGAPPRPYQVAVTSLDLTDTTRNADSRQGRHLPTLVFYPTAGNNLSAETPSAPGLFHGWPLVVFAHGYNVTPLTYHDILHHLAQAGFVVAAPSFPLETQGGPLDENDLQNEPADISFVITRVLAASSGTGVLATLVDPDHIAVVGHSDGGEAALGVAFLPGASDSRIGPVVAMAAQAILNGDKVAAAPSRHPLLVVHGTNDTIVPMSKGDQVFASAPTPKAYLRLFGAGHLPPVADANQWRPVVEATIVDWLDAWFGPPNSTTAASRLGHDANVSGTSSIQLG
ncbi:MAG: alpha/beta hydrolase family protein [Acidimicrobiales bacterium]